MPFSVVFWLAFTVISVGCWNAVEMLLKCRWNVVRYRCWKNVKNKKSNWIPYFLIFEKCGLTFRPSLKHFIGIFQGRNLFLEVFTNPSSHHPMDGKTHLNGFPYVTFHPPSFFSWSYTSNLFLPNIFNSFPAVRPSLITVVCLVFNNKLRWR